jgi:hypothetical protein
MSHNSDNKLVVSKIRSLYFHAPLTWVKNRQKAILLLLMQIRLVYIVLKWIDVKQNLDSDNELHLQDKFLICSRDRS